mgnify:CR=1 FL=1
MRRKQSQRYDVLTHPDAPPRVGVEPGQDDEGTLGRARVRHEEGGVAAAHLVRCAGGAELDQVEVEGALAPPDGAGAAVAGLDAVQGREQIGRGEAGGAGRDGVEIVALLGSADRVGLDETRHAADADLRLETQLLHRSPQRRLAVAQVAAQGDHERVLQASGDGDADVGEGMRDGCGGFVHRHLDGMDARKRQAVTRDGLGEGFDEVVGGAGDPRHRKVGHGGVVDRVGQGVAAPGGAVVGAEHDIDDELLPVALLVVEDAVKTRGAQAGQRDAVCRVSHSWPPTRRGRRRWRRHRGRGSPTLRPARRTRS